MLLLLLFLLMIELGRQINESSLRGCITGGAVTNLAPSEPAHVCNRITTFVLCCAVWNHWPAPLLTHGFQCSIIDRILFFITSLWYIFVAQFTMAFPSFCCIQYHLSDEKKEKNLSSFNPETFCSYILSTGFTYFMVPAAKFIE